MSGNRVRVSAESSSNYEAGAPSVLLATGARVHGRSTARGPHFRLPRTPELVVPASDETPDIESCEIEDRGLATGVKRAMDVAGALFILVLLGVPMLVIAVLIRLGSPGPALYTQERVGLGGRRFMLLKFRTMRVDAEDATGPVWAQENDPRRTLLGSLLRQLSMDELPQLINVLRGEMSLVGPRPERPYFVAQFAQEFPNYMHRHSVLPGLTGWAQLNGLRGNTSISMRLDFDLHYIRHWSLALDVFILLATPFRLLTERNAY